MLSENLEEPAAIPENTVSAGLPEDTAVMPSVAGVQEEFLDDVEIGINTGFQGTVSHLAQAVYREQSIQIVEEAAVSPPG